MGTSRKNNLFIYSFNRHLLTAQCEQDPVFTNWFPGPRLSQAGTTVIGEDYQFAELKIKDINFTEAALSELAVFLDK